MSRATLGQTKGTIKDQKTTNLAGRSTAINGIASSAESPTNSTRVAVEASSVVVAGVGITTGTVSCNLEASSTDVGAAHVIAIISGCAGFISTSDEELIGAFLSKGAVSRSLAGISVQSRVADLSANGTLVEASVVASRSVAVCTVSGCISPKLACCQI